mmetsp:Transcript_127167/g.231050  ORF Transcript_127167/g.231050 Transcript_127167/m.231050 type:complete len:432 (-) Transcript_127167:37-1332(-)
MQFCVAFLFYGAAANTATHVFLSSEDSVDQHPATSVETLEVPPLKQELRHPRQTTSRLHEQVLAPRMSETHVPRGTYMRRESQLVHPTSISSNSHPPVVLLSSKERVRSTIAAMSASIPYRQQYQTLAREQFSPEKCSGTKMLIVIYGLMRSYQTAWPRIQQMMYLDKWEACGAEVHVLVSTSIQSRCSGKDEKRDPVLCNELSSMSDEAYLAGIRKTYGSRLKAIFVSEAFNTDRISAALGHMAGERNGVSSRSARSMMRDFVQSLQGSGAVPYLQRFDYAVALRADVVLSAHLDVPRACGWRPGFNVISGVVDRPCFIHRRDWDLGYLACSAKLLEDFFGDASDRQRCRVSWQGCLDDRCSPPPLPRDFTGSWTTPCGADHGTCACAQNECDRVLQFKSLGIRLGTLDNYTYLKIVRFDRQNVNVSVMS